MRISAAASPEARVSAVVVERSEVPMPVRMTAHGVLINFLYGAFDCVVVGVHVFFWTLCGKASMTSLPFVSGPKFGPPILLVGVMTLENKCCNNCKGCSIRSVETLWLY